MAGKTTKKRTASTSSEPVHVWLALDPETRRVLVQTHEWQDGDFPPGLRGQDWPRREYDVPREVYDGLLQGAAEVDPVGQDRLHRDWWDAARKDGEPLWPNV